MFIGLDWGDSHHQLCILDPAGGPGSSGKETRRTQRRRPFQPLALVSESRTLPKPRNAFRLLRPAARPCQRDPGTPTPSSFADLDLTEDVPSSFADLDLTEDVALRAAGVNIPGQGDALSRRRTVRQGPAGPANKTTPASNAVQPDLTSLVATHPRLWIGVPVRHAAGKGSPRGTSGPAAGFTMRLGTWQSPANTVTVGLSETGGPATGRRFGLACS